jgi:hypothetical protein
MAEAHYHTNYQDGISEMLPGERDVGPTYGFTTSSEVGSGDIISTLQTGYPHVQTSTRQRARHVPMRYHVPRGSKTHLLA